MKTRNRLLAPLFVLVTLLVTAAPAGAHATREFLGSFGSLQEPSGIAIDQETGNVYVVETKTGKIDIFGATGGSPTGGLPTEITGVRTEPISRELVTGVAVDNSCYEHEPRLMGTACEEYDPSYGDVYFAMTGFHAAIEHLLPLEKFELVAGKYELTGELSCTDQPIYGGTPAGVAVDSRGNVYCTSPFSATIFEWQKTVEKTVNTGKEEFNEKLEQIAIPQHIIVGSPEYITVSPSGEIYLGHGVQPPLSAVGKVKLDAANAVESEEVFTGPPAPGRVYWRPVAVDPVNGAVFVGEGDEVAEFDPAGELRLRFGSSGALEGLLGTHQDDGAEGIAVSGNTGVVYVVNPAQGDVDMFGPVVAPPVVEAQQPAATDVTRTSALISGVANPESGQAKDYFEYVSDAEYQPAAADPYNEGGRTSVVAMAGGHSPEDIERVALTGLKPATTYHYRLVVSNANTTTYGPDETFTTAPATPPLAGTGPASAVGPTSATLTGVVAPKGLSTSYVFEVGTDTGYHGAKLFGDAGSATGEVSVAASLQYLAPGTTYHYRLVATSFDGTSYGQDQTFTTPPLATAIPPPGSVPLIASPAAQFPSIAGAVAKQPAAPIRKAAARKNTGTRGCNTQRRKRRKQCEARARRSHKRAAKTTRKKKG